MTDTQGSAQLASLQKLLRANKKKRVVVLGPPCIGKSSLVQQIPESRDMDDILFPQLSLEEKRVVFRKPWRPSVGQKMKELARQKIVVEPGRPVFATVILEADLIIWLQIDDLLLQRRIANRLERPQIYQDVKAMEAQLSYDIERSGILYVIFEITDETQL